jgi:hypothetical protein
MHNAQLFFSSERSFSEVTLMQTRRSIHSIQWLLLALVMLFIPPPSFGQVVGISITVAPPALPVYVQPVCPGENYIWTPGYWAYSDDDEDYYWVPVDKSEGVVKAQLFGAVVRAPRGGQRWWRTKTLGISR